MSYGAAYASFKKLLKLVNIDESQYGLHSARRGATSDAFRKNIPDFVIDLKGRWKSSSTKYRYLKLRSDEIVSASSGIVCYR